MGEKPEEFVKDLIARYIGRKPKTIRQKLSWSDDRSEIRISGYELEERVKYLSSFRSRVSLKA